MKLSAVDHRFYSDIASASRLLEEQSYFAIPATFSNDGQTARLPISLITYRHERLFDFENPVVSAHASPASIRYSYRARYCEITHNKNGTYDIELPVIEEQHISGAEERMVLGAGKLLIGENLDALHLNIALTTLFGKAGYFENSSMSYRATKAIMELTGARGKISAFVADFFPARRKVVAHSLTRKHSRSEIRIRFC